MKIKTTLVAAIIFSCSSVVLADPQKTIDYRQSVFTIVGNQMGVLAGMARGKIPYDQAAAIKAANTMAQMAVIAPDSFKTGTYGIANTEALSTVDSKQAKFNEIMLNFQKTSATLASTMATADAFPRKEFGAMAKNCKACHQTFKAD